MPNTQQVEAASRALTQYRELGEPRRICSSLIQLASVLLGAKRDGAAVNAALDEARALLRPDWPPEFRIRLLRLDGTLARNAGWLDEARSHMREAVRASAPTGDWRLEVIARTYLVDLLWETGPIEEAKREALTLAGELRAKPAADNDMDIMLTNVMGILSEMGRIDDASAAACEALPLMRRTGNYFVEEWAYLFWRRGQFDAAARLLGRSDANRARNNAQHQPNEQRLIDEARAGLEAALPADVLASHLVAGASLGDDALHALIAEALVQPSASRG